MSVRLAAVVNGFDHDGHGYDTASAVVDWTSALRA